MHNIGIFFLYFTYYIDGELYAWGSNEFGQLGIGSDPANISKPTLIVTLDGLPISFIACGGYHSFVVSKSGKIFIIFLTKFLQINKNVFEIGAVFGWGKNDFGQLGLNHQTNVLIPTELQTIRSVKVKYITGGEDFSVFLTHVLNIYLYI